MNCLGLKGGEVGGEQIQILAIFEREKSLKALSN